MFNLKKQQIPKKIHYCWFSGDAIPGNMKKSMASWRKFCPDYEIIRWDEINYDVAKHEYTDYAYETQKWSQLNNYARLEIIYENGGIYLDCDVELTKPLDDLLFHKAFVSLDANGNINLGSGFGAKKHFPLTDALSNIGSSLGNGLQHINGVAVYPKGSFAIASDG
jgi:mannosyltransferase OCH1-like enzyme